MISLFIDFDDTLADTAAAKQKLVSLFEQHGVPSPDFHASYTALRDTLYHPCKHAEAIWGKLPPGFQADYDKFITSFSDRVFPDALAFLQNIDLSQYDPVIFTYGDDEFQRAKIAASGIDKYVTSITTCQNEKWLAIGSIVLASEQCILVDNSSQAIVMLARSRPKSYGIIVSRTGRERPAHYPLFTVVETLADINGSFLPERFPQLITPQADQVSA